MWTGKVACRFRFFVGKPCYFSRQLREPTEYFANIFGDHAKALRAFEKIYVSSTRSPAWNLGYAHLWSFEAIRNMPSSANHCVPLENTSTFHSWRRNYCYLRASNHSLGAWCNRLKGSHFDLWLMRRSSRFILLRQLGYSSYFNIFETDLLFHEPSEMTFVIFYGD